MFVNYFRDEQRSSPVNLAVARLIVGFWLIWKTVWYDWTRLVDAPYRPEGGLEWAIPSSVPGVLTVEKWVLIVLLCLFVIGYRLQFTAGMSSLLLCHLASVRSALVGSGETENLYVGVIFLLFFALYAEADELSVDGIRRQSVSAGQSISDRLQSLGNQTFSMPSLKYSLLFLGVLYFSTGLSKITGHGGLGFVAPDNLTRLVVIRSYKYPWYEASLILAEYPILSTFGGIGTLLIELGLLVAILAGFGFSSIMAGLIIFVFTNLLLLGIFFPDNLFFLSVFLAHDRIYSRIVSERQIDVVFDDQCTICTQVLYALKLMDVNDTVTCIPRSDAMNHYQQSDDLTSDSTIYVVTDCTMYEGYDAFRELLRQFRIFSPVIYIMRFSVIRGSGARIFQKVADIRK